MPGFRIRLAAMVAMAAVAALALADVASARASGHDVSGHDADRSSLVSGWTIQSSAVVHDSGAEISRPGYSTEGWLPLSEPETLMAGLIENGAIRTSSTATTSPRCPRTSST